MQRHSWPCSVAQAQIRAHLSKQFLKDEGGSSNTGVFVMLCHVILMHIVLI